jgi:hypothetical protein
MSAGGTPLARPMPPSVAITPETRQNICARQQSTLYYQSKFLHILRGIAK